jgi:hypothetical protein
MGSQWHALIVVGAIALLSPAHADDDDSRVSARIMQTELCQGVVKWRGRVEIDPSKDMPHPTNCAAADTKVGEQNLNVCRVGSVCSIDARIDQQGIQEIWSISRVR